MNKTLDTNKLRVAEVRYYDSKMGGVEVSSTMAYAFLYRIGDRYVNVLDPSKEFPVFSRAPYSNVLMSGLEFGNRLFYECGDLCDGACYVMSRESGEEIFGREAIEMETLKSYILNSNYFFLDRADILKSMPFRKRLKYLPLLFSDGKKMSEFYAFLDSHDQKKMVKRHDEKNF